MSNLKISIKKHFSKTKLFFIFCSFITLFLCNYAYGDIGYEGGKISIVLSKSDFIFIGKVKAVEKNESVYKSTLDIIEVLKGNNERMPISINSRLNKGHFLEDEEYLQKDNIYILFCIKSDNGYSLTVTGYSVLSIANKEDLLILLNAYKSNTALFTKNGKSELFKIYSQLKTENIKNRLLADLDALANEEDIAFLTEGITSNDNLYKYFSIKKAGDLKIESFKGKIVNIISNEKDANILFYALVALGNYADTKNKDIFLSFLNHSDQGLRRVSIEALGKSEDEEGLLKMVASYEQEKDFGNRVAMIEALMKIKNSDTLNSALLKTQEKEKNDFVWKFIQNRLRK